MFLAETPEMEKSPSKKTVPSNSQKTSVAGKSEEEESGHDVTEEVQRG